MCSSGSLATLASNAADALLDGRAHVEPNFLSDDALAASRADMSSALAQIAQGQGKDLDDFESIQTDLLDPDFRRQLPTPYPFSGLLGQIDALRTALAQSTGRALLDGGGFHLMRYASGSKFMRHVDEDPAMEDAVRNSISFLIYLTDPSWSTDDGGALRLYERGGEEDAPRLVVPAGGTLVLYDSTMEHEVDTTRRERHLISGRFRELHQDWQSYRDVG